jgi:hypothetical protein
MEYFDLIIGVTTPTLAIIAEKFNPISERAIGQQAEMILARSGIIKENPHKDAVRMWEGLSHSIKVTMANMTSGAVELSALFPTWIAICLGIAVAGRDLVNPTLLFFSDLVVTIVLFALLSKIIGGNTYLSLSVEPLHWRICRGCRTGVKCISRVIIVLNVILIFMCVVSFLVQWYAARST